MHFMQFELPRRSFSALPVERLVGRVVFCARSINDKRALFTASSFGKAWATSALSTTMFDDSRTRFAYLPRTKPSGKSDGLYSERNSSRSEGNVSILADRMVRTQSRPSGHSALFPLRMTPCAFVDLSGPS